MDSAFGLGNLLELRDGRRPEERHVVGSSGNGDRMRSVSNQQK